MDSFGQEIFLDSGQIQLYPFTKGKKALLINYALLAVLLKCSNKILLSAAQA